MAKSCALLLSVALQAVSMARAETVVVRADWLKARALLTQGEFHPRSRKEVELKPSTWVKGKFIQANEADLLVLYRGHEISFPTEDISRIRLVPRTKSRWASLVLGIPAGFGAALLAALLASGGDVDRRGGAQTVAFIATLIAVPYLFHKLWGGSRGAVVVVLQESTANNAPVPAQIRYTPLACISHHVARRSG